MRAIALFLTLLAMWLLWSGHYTKLLIGFGVASSAGVTLLCHRLGIVRREALPIELAGRILPYLGWLTKAVVEANFDIARRVLSPGLPISPAIAELRSSQKSDLGRVTYANSITLTPGTVTLEATSDGELTVHALSRASVRALERGNMDRRVTAIEGSG